MKNKQESQRKMKKGLQSSINLPKDERQQTTTSSLKNKPSVKQPAALLKSKEIIPKDQNKTSSTITSKTTSTLNVKSQRISTSSSSILDQSNIQSSQKVSSNASINQMSNSILTEMEVQEEESKESAVVEVKQLTFNLKTRSDIPRFFKQLESMIQGDSIKLNLVIDSIFLDAKDFLNFCNSLSKSATRIKHLTWKVTGKFTNEGVTKSIGDVIGKCTSAFSININVEYTYFADEAANSLASGLKKLPNLRIFVLKADEYHYLFPKRVSPEGNNKINRAIQTLRKLQKIDYNGLNWDYVTITPHLRNYFYEFEYMCKTKDYQPNNYFEQFKEKIEPLKEQLTELSIRQREINSDKQSKFCQSCDEDYVDFGVYRDFLEDVICYSINKLPYLVYFNEALYLYRGSHYDWKVKKKSEERYDKLSTILQNLILKKREIIQIIFIFNKYIALQLPLNPKVIFTDLLVD